VKNKNLIKFYCKKKTKTKTKQGCDKKSYPKLMLNKLKVIESLTSIYTPWGPNSMKPPWKFSSSCVAHVYPYGP
jgi:hypothetical protein